MNVGIRYSFLIDIYKLRDLLPKLTLQLIALELYTLAKVTIKSIRIEAQKSAPNLERVNLLEWDLFYFYCVCLGFYGDVMSYTDQRSNIEKYRAPLDPQIKNVEELYNEIECLVERYMKI